MNPAFSVIFLTTLIGTGQGLFLALYTGESYATVELLPRQENDFYVVGSMISLVFLIAGLIASFFHLGHPERAWRAATQWRTSWLSREVIVLPVVMGLIALYGLSHHMNFGPELFGVRKDPHNLVTLLIGTLGVVATFGLFICTGMIYGCIRFIQEWSTPLTVINYLLLGTASGFVLASAYAAFNATELVRFYGGWAIIITLTALITRTASLIRNNRIKQRTTIQTAIGIRHQKITQRSQGFMGGSFNTREFFHGKTQLFLRSIKWVFLVTVFVIPVVLLIPGMKGDAGLLLTAFVIQFIGLIAERWFFFAQANHPQNLYYQTVG
ncbi:MAG: dimethyl sulfoxide reductase anchor subunit [Gammaproteobacteria bacterium]|nr:dimethyl sulfoxide reductase anchor subunit [Gammaproteobacteria bacterium]MDH5592874.1 dimethyl sulfoxide reductase anchor subunit [Gammaproteobacteria bacterium]